MGAIIILLKALLYEDQSIYIAAPVGDQSKELFTKIEEIVLKVGKTSASIDSLKKIASKEIVITKSNSTGFIHAQSGFHVSFYNGSEITSLNGKPDNNRSKRSSLVFFDESGFMSEEAISIMEAFATQNSNFSTSTKKNYDVKAKRKKCPTQLIYASSASDVDTTFFRHYKDFAKQMFLGDNNYFCCDIPCEIPLHPIMNGEKYTALLTQSKIDSAMKSNKEKAIREYFNKFTKDGGEDQIVKWGEIRRNETFLLPEVCSDRAGGKYVIAFDPARINDNSIITIMKIIKDKNIGYYGKIVNCINLIDKTSNKNIKLSSPEQIKILKEQILNYNGNAPDYENILAINLDDGAGGGGISAFGDNLLEEWQDSKGISHKGFLDIHDERYEGYFSRYPNTSDKLHLISAKKYRTQMVEEFIELMKLDLLKFPKEYNGKGYITLERKKKNGEIELYDKKLSREEETALMQMDLLKIELTAIHKITNPENTNKTYRIPKDKESTIHDDRFYTIILLSHFLYNLRRENIINKKNQLDLSKIHSFVSRISF
ncbi:hypothetical protein ACFHWD_04020 [Clostridium sp. MT-14]|uniref:hypothetical protein n=1 Tax=Clostridium sp. MT-14 TaxID=3348360 RepID=UPI0035F3AE83